MKKSIILILITFIIATSCTDNTTDCENPDYSNCNGIEPHYGQLNIELTINRENTKVPIIIYTGKIENNNVYQLDTATSNNYSLTVDINHYYSVQATYKSGNKTIIAVDGDDVKSKSSSMCDSTCWKVQDGNIDLRLKYD
ncbi:MAG: hypothetical protein AUJ97_07385 [Bacteroidetes bacterium CG2_30_32_10]|nr:MAG: hypothetical protein AUJ97_07385 [Bacteroidetes bacterium CG2_30_32_10]